MAPTKLDTLRSDRAMIAVKIEFYRGELAGHAIIPLQIEHVELYLKETSTWWKEAEKNFKDINALNPADLDDDKTEYFSLLRSLKKIQTELYPIYKSFPKASATPPPPPPPSSSSTVKLPRIEIQPFYGDYLEWTTFKESFIAAVHTHPQLTKVQKFSYLKSLLKGEAARYTADLALTDANYDQALTQLNGRYENKRKIATAILDKMFNHPVIHASAKSARSLVDSTSRCIRSLEVIGIKKEEMWDVFSSYLFMSKLDPIAKDKFEFTVQDTELPKIESLCKFLEKHANSLDETQKSQKHNERRANVHYTNANNNNFKDRKRAQQQYKPQYRESDTNKNENKYQTCSLGCKDNHDLYFCKKFAVMAVNDRHAQVRKEKACMNCLNKGHSANECPRNFKCKKCGKPHSTLLHYENSSNGYSWKTKEDEMRKQGVSKVFHTKAGNRFEESD